MSVRLIINACEDQLKRPLQSSVRSETYNTVNQWILKLLEKLRAHEKTENQILANKSLSPQGKTDKLRELATNETLPALKWLVNVLDELTKKDARFRQEFFVVDLNVPDAMLRFWILHEIRQREFEGMDQGARDSRFVEAALKNDVPILAAMLDYQGAPLVTQEVQERGLLSRAETTQPERYQAYQQNTLLIEWAEMARDWVARWLLELGVNTEDLDRTLKTNLSGFTKKDSEFRSQMEASLRERMGEQSTWPENQEQAERREKNEDRAREQTVNVPA